MRLPRLFVLYAIMALAPPAVSGQTAGADTLQVEEIHLQDGSVLYGRVIQQGDPIRIRLLSGDVIEIAGARVVSVLPAQGRVVKGEFWREDPNLTRLFFGPTARGLKRGKGYVAGYELFLPFVGIAVTDDVILAGGTFLFGGFENRPYWLAPKVRLASRGTTDLAIGALVFRVEDHSAGVLYGVATRGTSDQAVSVGLGYGFSDGDLADKPMAMFGFEVRTTKSIKFISENYVFPGGVGLISIGPRFFGERLSADLGIAVVFDGDQTASFPLVNFVYAW